MDDDEFTRKLREAFSIEADEHLQTIIKGMLEVEKSASPSQRREIVEVVFREAHSLKGAARAVRRTDIETICQALESVFALWKRTNSSIPVEAFDGLNAALDLVAKLLQRPEVSASSSDENALRTMTRRVMRLAKFAPPETPSFGAALEGTAPSVPGVRAALEGTAPSVPGGSEREEMTAAETVRVPMRKMDAILVQAEEMLALKLTTTQHAADLRELRATLRNWRKEWAKARFATRGAGGATRDFLQWNGAQIETLEKKLGLLAAAADRDERSASTMIDDLLSDAKRLVMLPIAWLLDFFPKQVRDLSREVGKDVKLIVRGSDVEIDKRVLEEMKAPLVHLVRNAIDHGLESPEGRAQRGKSTTGTLAISVSQVEGNKVEITISDDGSGIDLVKVRASAVKNGIISESDAGELGESAALALIFQSGVSTSPILTEISGRGLGMAIVREKVDKLGGQIAIETKPHAGTSFRMVLPLTLATFKGILVSVGGQTFAIPISSVQRIIRVHRSDIRTVENRDTICPDGHPMSFAWLSDILELPRREPKIRTAFLEVLILSAAEQQTAFAVDTIINEQEVLIKKLSKPLIRLRNIAGATVLGSGAPVLILNVADLLKSATRLAAGGIARARLDAMEKAETPVHHVLVADDSVTSRMLLKNILESGGYHVTTAADGMDAFAALRGGGFDLVVSDVEMPRMDGFEFTAKIRAEKRFAELPVVLVTALGSREHKERGIDVGANAYIVKSSFDQSNLLEVIRKLV